jgi:hypothetical protein
MRSRSEWSATARSSSSAATPTRTPCRRSISSRTDRGRVAAARPRGDAGARRRCASHCLLKTPTSPPRGARQVTCGARLTLPFPAKRAWAHATPRRSLWTRSGRAVETGALSPDRQSFGQDERRTHVARDRERRGSSPAGLPGRCRPDLPPRRSRLPPRPARVRPHRALRLLARGERCREHAAPPQR